MHTGMTASSKTPKQASGNEIRSRLLRRLGIHEDDASMSSSMDSNNMQQQQRRPSVQTFHVPLKYKEETKHQDDNTTTKSSSSSTIAFHQDVSVIPIPMRTEYSERIKSRLWCDRAELQRMAQRNLLEYEYEGWNWRNVMEDHHMLVSSTTGELVHPVHYRLQSNQQHFLPPQPNIQPNEHSS